MAIPQKHIELVSLHSTRHQRTDEWKHHLSGTAFLPLVCLLHQERFRNLIQEFQKGGINDPSRWTETMLNPFMTLMHLQRVRLAWRSSRLKSLFRSTLCQTQEQGISHWCEWEDELRYYGIRDCLIKQIDLLLLPRARFLTTHTSFDEHGSRCVAHPPTRNNVRQCDILDISLIVSHCQTYTYSSTFEL
ncbi:hypothetical protein BDR04DRAFT_843780 [Suillus decipiens]|nr:hypothetical protein BDR04DRAFT_843780 [Suillus decipiens]